MHPDASPDKKPTSPSRPAGWYTDEQGLSRWWNGSAWTEHVQSGEQPAPQRAAVRAKEPENPSTSSVASGSRVLAKRGWQWLTGPWGWTATYAATAIALTAGAWGNIRLAGVGFLLLCTLGVHAVLWCQRTHPEHRRAKRAFEIALITPVVLFPAVGILVALIVSGVSGPADHSLAAVANCKDAVRDQLAVPSSANFEDPDVLRAKSNGNYKMELRVRSEGRLGGRAWTLWLCLTDPEGQVTSALPLGLG